MDVRYEKNLGPLALEEIALLWRKRVCVVGCGGLGGFCIEELARLGIGALTVVDGDRFQESNLNRQIGCAERTLGQFKASWAAGRVTEINKSVQARAWNVFLTEENAGELLAGHDLILDALDRPEPRVLLEREAGRLGIPLVHGAVGGWGGQVTSVFPGDRVLELLYDGLKEPAPQSGVVVMAVAAVASLQTGEAAQVLLGRPGLRGILLRMNLSRLSFEKIRLFRE
ncbi:HesA/MoeB/ThiF family protein [Anaerotruncus colihominis]|uniref:HesA/MoeB/ThiF family protein n=1 Tax=Anaerotruncus colihominis TaxID=169435 RepID=A0A845RI10_9FIRM|nr:ThiF family adenylyltransferase [Anaerotruncus colihominis]MCR2024011.1 ThiF family adenylyltransferase [Anaerotruncus colihominis]NBI79686.1 HesA/MoeB/ThiF family protein [Anaerotruncus colihominis]NDO39437.1 HesA/MoeB/ThiF family protein [Anaerotruncus colihominis]